MAAKVAVPKNVSTGVFPEAVLDPEGTYVTLGAHTYRLRPVPIARSKDFKRIWLDFWSTFNGVTAGADSTEGDVVNVLFGLIEDKPYELLKVVIPDLDHDAFYDEETGATIPEVIDALDQALVVNRLELLKKALPFVMETIRQETIRQQIRATRKAIEEAGEETS